LPSDFFPLNLSAANMWLNLLSAANMWFNYERMLVYQKKRITTPGKIHQPLSHLPSVEKSTSWIRNTEAL
jgi:hypothetical protein